MPARECVRHRVRAEAHSNEVSSRGSADNKKLYWTALNGHTLWSIPTDVLSDPKAGDEELQAAILNEGERPAADGILGDQYGNLYFGAYDQQSIVRRNPVVRQRCWRTTHALGGRMRW